ASSGNFGLELYASPMTDHLAVTENKDAGPSWWTVAEHRPMGCTPLCGATDGPAPHVPSVSLGRLGVSAPMSAAVDSHLAQQAATCAWYLASSSALGASSMNSRPSGKRR